ncbi:MAG: aromatic amino acid hydroxylase [Bdellovibrionaceae bacterium]|nr:aromatic amino acid hydroxylase [Pseudobdellovibrionaceae bacterium]
MTEPLAKNLEIVPIHLRKFVVDQNYQRYTPEDQAVWRFILSHLTQFLSENAHPCYMDGLKKTGITLDRIPKIKDIDQNLKTFGWRAIPVSGFIPPAAFMEFQSQGFLPIASDMRTLEHILYTPAPDIVHEAAGHAPILVDPGFSDYLRKYAQIANKAIMSYQDLHQYELIRNLSDLKESPLSTPQEIKLIENELSEHNLQMSFTSEAGFLSRMNWWTAEYGLIGDLKNPKIFGAGLLSSLSESRGCLQPEVKKIPLSVDCIHFSYDITEPQPQLFVTPNFETLSLVLDDFSKQLSFRQGGKFGLDKAIQAKTVNTIELDSGLQISGIFSDYIMQNDTIVFVKTTGPTQLSINNKELHGHNKNYHIHGYSTPLGPVHKINKCLSLASKSELRSLGLVKGSMASFNYQSGVSVNGRVVDLLENHKNLFVISLEETTVKLGDQVLFSPDWGTFDLAVGSEISSVFGGASDRISYGELEEDFNAKTIPTRNYSEQEKIKHKIYTELECLKKSSNVQDSITKILIDHQDSLNWLMLNEILSYAVSLKINSKFKESIINKLKDLELTDNERQCLNLSLS